MLHIGHIARHKHRWWRKPSLPDYYTRRMFYSERNRRAETVNVVRTKRVGEFDNPKKWVYYPKLGIDIGYICMAYSLKDIRKRYGISHATVRHWRIHILPDPIKLYLRNGHYQYHWSKIHLLVLDTILKDLWFNGVNMFTSKFEDHIELYHYGCRVMEDYFEEVYEQQHTLSTDKYGVSIY